MEISNKMKVVILGSKGMLAQDLNLVFKEEHPVLMDKEELDITNEQEVKKTLLDLKPDLILNAAAYTNVDQAEKNKNLAFRINGQAVGYLARVAAKIKAVLVHFSTDYVFSGKKKEGYKEDDQPKNPLNIYGASKLAGEREILKTKNLKYYLARISWLFGPSGRRGEYKNFVETIINLAKKNQEIKVVNDQFGKPSYSRDIAQGVKYLLDNHLPSGIYHLPNEPLTTWYNFAKKIIEIKGLKTKIIPCLSKEFKTLAARPKYSALLNTKFPLQRNWQRALKEYLYD